MFEGTAKRLLLAFLPFLCIWFGFASAAERDFISERFAPDSIRLRQALYVANACEAAYMPEAALRNMLKAMGVQHHEFLDFPSSAQLSDTQVLVATLGNYTLVCFRGTQELADWRTNLAVSQVSVRFHKQMPTLSVHAGFYGAWKEISSALFKYLDRAGVTRWRDPALTEGASCHEVLIGGHSLGGALAVLAGLEAIGREYHVLGIYTFGQPKVFGPGASQTEWSDLDDILDLQRFVFGSDPVPALPPGYIHIGRERYSTRIGDILKSPRDVWYWPSVGDHKMANYVKTIAALISLDERSPEAKPILDWLRRRDTPLPAVLSMTPRAAADVAINFSTRGGREPMVLCGRRTLPNR